MRVATLAFSQMFGLYAAYSAEPAIIQAARSGDLSAIRALVDAKSDLHALGARNQTALHEAAAKCSVEVVRILLGAGIDRAVRDQNNRSAAEVALDCPDSKEKLQIVGLLAMETKGRPRNDESAPWSLHSAAAHGQVSLIEMLLQLGSDVNAIGTNGNRPIEIACRAGQTEVVRVLLDRGADIRLATGAGTTVLHEAALGGSVEVIEMLLTRGARIDAPDIDSGSTALHYAASFGRAGAAKVLVQRGADVHLKNRKGLTALDTAAKAGQGEVVSLLRGSR